MDGSDPIGPSQNYSSQHSSGGPNNGSGAYNRLKDNESLVAYNNGYQKPMGNEYGGSNGTGVYLGNQKIGPLMDEAGRD